MNKTHRTPPRKVVHAPGLLAMELRLDGFVFHQVLRQRHLARSGEMAKAQEASGYVEGAQLALSLLDKVRRGWFTYEQIPEELISLAEFYEKKSRSSYTGSDIQLESKASTLRWIAQSVQREMNRSGRSSHRPCNKYPRSAVA